MKVVVYETEWYPVTTYHRAEEFPGNAGFIDVEDDVIARYDAAKKAFFDAAKELAESRSLFPQIHTVISTDSIRTKDGAA